MDLRKVISHLGIILGVFAMFMVTALPWAWIDRETEAIAPWLSSIGVTFFAGVLFYLAKHLPRPAGTHPARGIGGRPNAGAGNGRALCPGDGQGRGSLRAGGSGARVAVGRAIEKQAGGGDEVSSSWRSGRTGLDRHYKEAG